MSRAWAVLLFAAVAGCGQSDTAGVVQRLFKTRQTMLEKPELLGAYRDGGSLVVVYTDASKMDGAWIRYKCYPPEAKSRWFCERIGDPSKNVFLIE